jgi:hypothetical protein
MWLVKMWDYKETERILEATTSVPIGSIREPWREVIGVCGGQRTEVDGTEVVCVGPSWPQDYGQLQCDVWLFTRVLIRELMSLLGQCLEKNVLRLLWHILISSYFSASGQLHEQTDGVTMGLPLSLVITSFFMEELRRHHFLRQPMSTSFPIGWGTSSPTRIVSIRTFSSPWGQKETATFLSWTHWTQVFIGAQG